MQHFEKLKLNYEFRRLYNRGKSLVCPCFVLYYARGRRGRTRLGITAGKKLGGAVVRNRAKRVITAAFAYNAASITEGFDFVIVARSRILKEKSTTVAMQLENLLRSAGLFANNESDI